nr:MAG TPA: hypothetical protein [Caudoviricetes sp.]
MGLYITHGRYAARARPIVARYSGLSSNVPYLALCVLCEV